MSSRSGRGDTRANGDIDSLPPPRSAPVILPPPDPHLDRPLSAMDILMASEAKSTAAFVAMTAKSVADDDRLLASITDGMDERDKERLLARIFAVPTLEKAPHNDTGVDVRLGIQGGGDLFYSPI